MFFFITEIDCNFSINRVVKKKSITSITHQPEKSTTSKLHHVNINVLLISILRIENPFLIFLREKFFFVF